MKMASKTSAKIVKIVERWAKNVRKEWSKDITGEEDALSQMVVLPDTTRQAILEPVPEAEKDYYDFSTRVVGFENVPCDGTVTILIDGLAWDLLSYESDYHAYRNELEEKLEAKGFYVENLSACAISIQEA
jgi:hypothetical protein